jgi:hypothetical protein
MPKRNACCAAVPVNKSDDLPRGALDVCYHMGDSTCILHSLRKLTQSNNNVALQVSLL